MKYENVKIGDEFVIGSRWSKAIHKVTKVTPKRFECGGCTFSKDSGYIIGGGSYNTIFLHEATEEARAEIREAQKRNKLIKDIESVKLNSLDTAIS